MTSYTKRCTSTRRVYWCKFGRNPTKSFCVICILVSLSLILRQGLSLDFTCLFIYSLAISPELFVCLSIYENAETCPPRYYLCRHLHRVIKCCRHLSPRPPTTFEHKLCLIWLKEPYIKTLEIHLF